MIGKSNRFRVGTVEEMKQEREKEMKSNDGMAQRVGKRGGWNTEAAPANGRWTD